ncbi:uncharacterized protein MONBRDRAFT_7329 [Monosiga brevicollis MX1]|uniref:Pyridoxamine 5'-phosphate oxidase Alr4036 family FMN-binding domain-containing protein n=1 Tax=Monosiga brevicollis TaxID=81824 RepID=A9UWM6_MONBE|nr:uncharacterized protein MONBRDRAFT_7329 [Monosiga brevicollis MX1]EDQ90239.1 predicted protein [Monosiga brevicollis MX1]|eukprot:XP_001745006.1 hypothetical protein [Monosiga brevicollis MX1]
MWRQGIEQLLREYSSVTARFMVLATADAAGLPHARTVVFRDWVDTNAFAIVSDVRHDKITQLTNNARFEACWYFGEARRQYRLGGTARILDGQGNATPEDQACRTRIWQGLSEATRAQYAWPTPREPLEPAALEAATAPPAEQAAPSTFCVVVCDVDHVDELQLDASPVPNRYEHRRIDGDWTRTALNP